MAGLNLINTYSSNSEDDETDKNASTKTVETRNRLPLPESIATWKGVEHHEKIVDDPLQHEGRLRSFEHERGNWSTLVYLDYMPSQAMNTWMTLAAKEVPIKCNVFSQQFHISLTRTLILKFHWIESFVTELKKLCCETDRFCAELLNVRAYSNEEKARTFLGIQCINRDGTLSHFVRNIDNLLVEYGLPPFYEDSSYHISFLWCLGDNITCLSHAASALTDKLNEFLIDHAEDRYIYVNEIHVKIGNKLYVFALR